MSITLDLLGADALAASAREAAHAVGDLTQVNRDAGDLVIGSTVIPVRTGALAASAHVEADAAGVSLVVGGPGAPYAPFVAARDPFFTDAITAQRDRVAVTYLDALRKAVAHLKGTS